jgi:hypothetical protein
MDHPLNGGGHTPMASTPPGVDFDRCFEETRMEIADFPGEPDQTAGKKQPEHRHGQTRVASHEAEVHDYYNWPMCWGMGLEPYAGVGYRVPTHRPLAARWGKAPLEKPADPNLRSTRQVTGDYFQATDGGIGHVQDFTLSNAAEKVLRAFAPPSRASKK